MPRGISGESRSHGRLDKLKHVPRRAARKLSALSCQLAALRFGCSVGDPLACPAGREPGPGVGQVRYREVREAGRMSAARLDMRKHVARGFEGRGQ